MSEKHIGKVLQVIGPVLDIQFEDGQLPELLSAIEIDNHGQKLIVEVAQLTGDNVARCIAMSSTDGLVRGTEAVDTGESIKVPVGDQCLGRVFNLLGEPVDAKPAPTPDAYWPIHRPAPSYEEQQSTTEILETGIKVVDLICPYAKGGKIGLFGGAGVGKQTRTCGRHHLASVHDHLATVRLEAGGADILPNRRGPSQCHARTLVAITLENLDDLVLDDSIEPLGDRSPRHDAHGLPRADGPLEYMARGLMPNHIEHHGMPPVGIEQVLSVHRVSVHGAVGEGR